VDVTGKGNGTFGGGLYGPNDFLRGLRRRGREGENWNQRSVSMNRRGKNLRRGERKNKRKKGNSIPFGSDAAPGMTQRG